MARERVAVIGAGTMGNGIAHVFAQHGHEVVMIDVSEDRLEAAKATIRANMDRQVKKGVLTEEEKAAALGRLTTAVTLEAAEGSGLVVEAVPEHFDLKAEILATVGTWFRRGSWRPTRRRSRSRRWRRRRGGR